MINQTPGLWDMVKPEAMAFMSQAMQRLNPDHFAQKRLQEMIQQNPMILDQIANMDETQRSAFAQQMGFRKTNPVAAIAPGEKRQTRERIAATRMGATPEQRAEGDAVEAGLPTGHALNRRGITEAREDQLFPVKFEAAVLDVKTGKLNLDNLQKETTKREKILERSPHGDLAAIARRVVYGQSVPNDVLERIRVDKPLAEAFEDYQKGFQMERDNDFRTALARIRNPQEKMILIPMLEKTIDDTAVRIKILESETEGKTGLIGGMFNPEVMGPKKAELAAAKKYKEDLEKQRVKIFEENGVKFTPPNAAEALIAKYSRPPL